jgi:hypothetical protein
MLVAFRLASCALILTGLACIAAMPELAGLFAALTLATEAARLVVSFCGPRL